MADLVRDATSAVTNGMECSNAGIVKIKNSLNVRYSLKALK